MNIENKKPLLFTGITATGTLTLGHYIAIIKNLVKLQEKYEIFLMIADLHAITTISEKRLPYADKTREIASLIYACGLKEENCKVFVQSAVSEHLELSYFLSSYCSTGRIANMIQYKEKSKDGESSNVSLLSYPILMASDILLYDADLVIVGKDQKQHLELAEYIAKKFNFDNENCLKIPTLSIPAEGSKIMGLRDPSKKMSKSSNDNISLLDENDEIRRKIMRAETDSEGKIYQNAEKKPGITNLLVIYSQLASLNISDVEKNFENSSYNELKNEVILLLQEFVKRIRVSFDSYNGRIDSLLSSNNQIIKKIASKKIEIVKKKIGLWN